MATSSAKLPTWYRAVASVVGVLSIVLALIVLAAPLLAVWLLIVLLACGLLFIGMDRLVVGISGHPFWWTMPVTPAPSSPMMGTAPAAVPVPKP